MKYVMPLNAHEVITLTQMHRHHPSSRVRVRAHSILLSHQGFSIPEITRICHVDRRRVSAWIDRWHTEGLAGLYDRPGSGRKTILSAEEQQRVQYYVQQYPKDLDRIIDEIEKETQKRVSAKTIRRIMKKIKIDGDGMTPHP